MNLMKSTEKVKLIDGKFTPVEAKELLLNVIGSKIRFHTTKSFSDQIRSGEQEKKSLEKIISLRGTRERIVHLLGEAEENGFLVEIESTISISCIDRSEVE